MIIVEHNAEWDFLREAGGGGVAVYSDKQVVENIAESIRRGLGDEVQSVRVARYVGERRQEKFRVG